MKRKRFKDCSEHGREGVYFISIFSIPSKVESFGLSRKKTFLMSERETESAKKTMPETGSQQMQVTGRYWCRTQWTKKLLSLSYCLTSKLMQVFNYSVFLSSCRLLFHDFFGYEHTAPWSISRPSQLRLYKCSCTVASPQWSEARCACVESLDLQLQCLLAERVMAPHSFPAGLLWPVLRNLLWFSES